MLAYILALAVGLGSLGIYLAAFFLPEIHRKIDFYWSGVGLFYALMLWVCAGRLTGGVLLGQIAAVSLLGWFCWQTLTLRRQLVPAAQQTELPTTAELQSKIGGLLTSVKTKIPGTRVPTTKGKKAPAAKTTASETVPTAATEEPVPAVVPTQVVEFKSEDTPNPPTVTEVVEFKSEDTPNPPTVTEVVEFKSEDTPTPPTVTEVVEFKSEDTPNPPTVTEVVEFKSEDYPTRSTVTTKPSPFEAIANPESTPDDVPSLVQEIQQNLQSENIPTSPRPKTEPEKPTDSI
ncbi:Ycf66 family protein [Microseira sp. BLCC-F43]|uniref:Ycf66 family protein n=1 Tax=Microseira sp. BLCC-F43 TaxID=3153602 RepID=UPI0035BB2FA6